MKAVRVRISQKPVLVRGRTAPLARVLVVLGIVLTWTILLVFPDPAAAHLWGRTGHAMITYTVATDSNFRIPPEMARVMALGAVVPDLFEFENPAAHAQTNDAAARTIAALAAEGRLSTRQLEERWRQEQQRSFTASQKWFQFYLDAAVQAMAQGRREQAAFLLGYALHNRQDLHAHQGMTNLQHAWLSHHGNGPDNSPVRVQRSLRATAEVLQAFKAKLDRIAPHHWQLFCGQAVHVPGQAGLVVPAPLTRFGDLSGWDPRREDLPLAGAQARDVEDRLRPLVTEKDVQAGEGRRTLMHNFRAVLARQEDMLRLLDVPRQPGNPPRPRRLVWLESNVSGPDTRTVGSHLEDLRRYDDSWRIYDGFRPEVQRLLDRLIWEQLAAQQATAQAGPGAAVLPGAANPRPEGTAAWPQPPLENESGSSAAGPGQAPAAEIQVIVTGSGTTVEEIRHSSWAPPSLAAPTPAGPSTTGTPPRRLGLSVNNQDLSIYVFEVKQRGWSTDGLEKYLKPPAAAAEPGVQRIPLPPGNPLAQPEVKKALKEAAGQPRTTIVIENWQQPRTGTEPSNARAQNERVAQLVAHVAQNHHQAHPQARRELYLQGSGAATLTPLLQQPAAQQLFARQVVVAPLQVPPSLPAQTLVVMPRDTMFHNFDPGSPGYERMTNRLLALSQRNPVVVLNNSVNLTPPHVRRPEMVYYHHGASAPVTLTNSHLGDVLRARSSSPVLPPALQRTEQLYKPSKVGGVSLVTPAELPLDGSTIRRAGYDAKTGRLMLWGKEGQVWRLPPLDAELVRLAHDCLYKAETAPELSIGVSPNDSTDGGKPGFWRVYYVGPIEGTRLGLILFRADHLLGDLAFGGSDVPQQLGLSDLPIHTLPELNPDQYADGPRATHYGGGLRTYLAPNRITLTAGKDGDLEFGDVTFDLRFDPSGPAQEECAAAIVTHWEELLRRPRLAAFRDLDAAARVVSLFVWLRDNGIPFDDSLAQVQAPRVATPVAIPVRPAPAVASLHPVLPLRIYTAEGLVRVYDGAGQATRILYRNGQVSEVRRHDGRWLKVHRDDIGQIAAIALSTGEAAAFYRQDEAEGYRFADKVQLQFANGVYTGFATTTASRFLAGVDPEELTATLMRNFVAEGHLPEREPHPWLELWLVPVGVVAALLFLLWLSRRRRLALSVQGN